LNKKALICLFFPVTYLNAVKGRHPEKVAKIGKFGDFDFFISFESISVGLFTLGKILAKIIFYHHITDPQTGKRQEFFVFK
jgi:hypothetical protein